MIKHGDREIYLEKASSPSCKKFSLLGDEKQIDEKDEPMIMTSPVNFRKEEDLNKSDGGSILGSSQRKKSNKSKSGHGKSHDFHSLLKLEEQLLCEEKEQPMVDIFDEKVQDDAQSIKMPKDDDETESDNDNGDNKTTEIQRPQRLARQKKNSMYDESSYLVDYSG